MKAFQKNKNKFNIQGFRKGTSANREDVWCWCVLRGSANEIIPEAYEKAALESELEIVSRPEIDVVQIEKGKPFIFTAEVAIKPEVTLGQYKGIEVEKKEVSVTDEEVLERINREREQNSRMLTIDDRPVQKDDIAVIDYEGFVDGVPFEGGKGENYSLTIGSNSFIDTFEERLLESP